MDARVPTPAPAPAPATAPSDRSPAEVMTELSVAALKLSIELGKDLLAVQAQRRQVLEQRAASVLPLAVPLLLALATALFSGHFRPEGGTLYYLVAMVVALLLALITALVTLMRARPGDFAGMEPRDVLHRYIGEGGERGALRVVADTYQSRIDANREQLRWINIGAVFAVVLVATGITYGALMVVQHHYGPSISAGAGVQGQAQPPAASP
jgi:hypothetical protein